MTDVFLSYSSADRAAANAVQAALTARGYDVFWDQEVPAGQDWDDWIRARLHGAKLCIVLWSKASIASPNVRHEAMIARDAKKLVPAMIEPLKPADFPMGLYLVQSVQLGDWRRADSPGMARLLAEAEARLGRGAGKSGPTDQPKLSAARGRRPPVLLLAGLALVLALGASWFLLRPATTPTSTSIEPNTEEAAPSVSLSATIEGRWRWNDNQTCADGTLIARDSVSGQPTLVFTAPDSRYEHAIESDTAYETRTRVTAPEFALGEQYVFAQDPASPPSDAERNFRLVV